MKIIDASTLPSNFTTDAPKVDAYLLKHIIHDWDDEHSEIIFRNINGANPNATIFVFEFSGPMPGANVPHLSKGFGKLFLASISLSFVII